jgi:hypothetical protein
LRKSLTMSTAVCFVGAARFERATSRTRTVRSTGLSHAPIHPRKGNSGRYYTQLPQLWQAFGIMKCLEFIQETAIRNTRTECRIAYFDV